MSFIHEFKCRKVIRAAAFCGPSASLVVQVPTRVSPFFGHDPAGAGKE